MPANQTHKQIDAPFAEAVRTIANAGDLDRLRRETVRCARQVLDADGATFVLRDDGCCFYMEENAISPLWRGQRFPMEACISGWAMLNREVAICPDVERDGRIPWPAYQPTFVRSLIMAPMRSVDPIGAVGIYWAERHEASDYEIEVLRCLAEVAAATVVNLQLLVDLEREKQLYRSVVEDQSELIVRWQPGGRRTFVNDAYRRAYGTNLLGTSFLEVIPSEDRAAVEAKITALTPEHPVATDVHRARLADGSVAWQEWVDRAIHAEDGTLLGYQSVGRDVTDRIRLEEQLSRTRAQEAVARLANGVAHDLNNLLAPIMGCAELLRERPGTDQTSRRLLQSMVVAAEQAGKLLAQMLAFGRQQQQRKVQILDLAATVEGLLTLARSTLGSGIALAFAADRPLLIEADPGRIGQVILNLTGNARDAQQGMGAVRLSVRRLPDDPDRACLACEDDGPGMDPAVAERAFDPYFTTKGSAGTGLGLATVAAIAAELGGEARIVPAEQGSGARVEVLLPLHESRSDAL